jgi:hypothetical protein
MGGFGEMETVVAGILGIAIYDRTCNLTAKGRRGHLPPFLIVHVRLLR